MDNDFFITADGDLNYVLYAYCKRYVPARYNSIKNYVGELRSCAAEIERRLLADREDQAIKENGDIL
jgi:hypothetical protein